MLKRAFDLSLCMFSICIFSFLIILIALFIRLTSKGSALYWSERVGRNNRIFKMPKFRTMKINTPELASHKLTNPENFLSPIGDFLRRNSLDELPQLFSIFKGDMSFVGPRPALYNQEDLIELRTKNNVHILLPGLTGWAQVNGRDELSIPDKVDMDKYYLDHHSIRLDIKILYLTMFKVIKADDVTR